MNNGNCNFGSLYCFNIDLPVLCCRVRPYKNICEHITRTGFILSTIPLYIQILYTI